MATTLADVIKELSERDDITVREQRRVISIRDAFDLSPGARSADSTPEWASIAARTVSFDDAYWLLDLWKRHMASPSPQPPAGKV